MAENEQGTAPAGQEAGQSFALGEIGQIAITVRDLDAAVAFYRDKLGMALLFTVPGMAFFDLGPVRLMLGTSEREDLDHRASIIYYRVRDIEAAAQALHDRGVEFEHEPRLAHPGDSHDLWLAFIRDMDGNFLGLMEEKPNQPVATN